MYKQTQDRKMQETSWRGSQECNDELKEIVGIAASLTRHSKELEQGVARFETENCIVDGHNDRFSFKKICHLATVKSSR